MGSGNVPEFGAIFMSNTRTRKECFKRRLFGLPYPFADFVKAVKSGMILFLFDYEERKLYGVFEAVSDGAIDIVPHAYSSSGKKFPAQLQFNVIWKCGPLLEREFRGAIKDNYYADYKFHFGLSKEQVYSLLRMFESRKVRVQKSPMGKSTNCHSPSADSGICDPKKGDPTIEIGASNLLKSESVALHKNTEQADVSSCSSSLGLDDYIPLSFPESPEPLEDPGDNDLKLKGMYSDLHVEKGSVFSRLNLVPELVEENEKFEAKEKRTNIFSRLESVSKATAQKEERKLEADKSVHEIMERSLQRQREGKRNAPASGKRLLGKRGNVFNRLKSASKKEDLENEDFEAKLDETLKKINEMIHGRKKKRALEENNLEEGEVDMTKRVETIDHTSLESNNPNNVSMEMGMSDELLNTKPRLRSLLSKNKLFDIQSLFSESCLTVQKTPERKENWGSWEDPIKSDALDYLPSPLPQKQTLSSVICYPITVTESLITQETCHLSASPSFKDSVKMAEESGIIFLEEICCEENEERWQMEEV